MEFRTKRMHLRPWLEADQDELFELARDPRVGPAAGWPAHRTRADSAEAIREVLSGAGNFAVTSGEGGELLGAIQIRDQPRLKNAGPDDVEIGFWIGAPFWGHGYAAEAAVELIRYAFEVRGAPRVWMAYHEGNTKSARVQEKLGFEYSFSENKNVPAGEVRLTHVQVLTREAWERRRP